MSYKKFFQAICWNIKYVNVAPLCLTLICLTISLASQETHSGRSGFFVLSSVLLIGLQFSTLAGKRNDLISKKSYQAFCFTFLWLLYSAIAALPFLSVSGSLGLGDFTRAFFEAMSGYTSTGLTMVDSPHLLAPEIQLFRSGLQWIGGVGFMMFILLTLSKRNRPDAVLSVSGLSDNRHIERKFVIRGFGIVYIALTCIAFFGLSLFGLSLWEALNHALTLSSTGGFSITPNSFTAYPEQLKWFTMVIMLAAALPLPVFYLALKGQWRVVMKDSEIGFYSVWILLLLFSSYLIFKQTDTDQIFNFISVITTSGFYTSDVGKYPTIALSIMTIIMMIGGCSNSTAGGIKIDRMIWVLKGTYHSLLKKSLDDVRYNGEAVEKSTALDEIRKAALFLITAYFIRKLSAYLVLFIESEGDLINVEFDIASALATTGMDTGFVSSNLSDLTIWIFSFLMWVGRVEFLAFAMFLLFIGRKIVR